MKELRIKDELSDFFENQGFCVYSADTYDDNRMVMDIGQSTPQGEDWHVQVEMGNGTYQDIINNIKDTSFYFDVDEEAEIWIENRGKNGVPSSIKALVEDAEWKEQELRELANKIESTFESKGDESVLFVFEFIKVDEPQYENHEWKLGQKHPSLTYGVEMGLELTDDTYRTLYELSDAPKDESMTFDEFLESDRYITAYIEINDKDEAVISFDIADGKDYSTEDGTLRLTEYEVKYITENLKNSLKEQGKDFDAEMKKAAQIAKKDEIER